MDAVAHWFNNLIVNMDILGYFATIRISDIVDITIIAYLIYHLLLLTRRTSSGQVVKGIALLLIALWASSLFQLHVLSFILNRTVELGLLALIIVFQPEIRRFLEQVGSSNLTKVFRREEKPSEFDNAIKQTVLAYTELSKAKIGALTVFERNISLADQIKTGTVLDAAVTSELLKNIFWPKAPMHDGAVVIRGGRIAGAGCMLPLSGNVNLSRDLGMRHRAGIGMSEHSDAVVALVSEETGAISVAVGGMLKRHLAPETLERLLRNELMPDEGDAPRKGGFSAGLAGLFGGRKGGGDHV